MGYLVNILSDIKSILSWEKTGYFLSDFLYREKPVCQKPLPKRKRSRISSESTVRVLPLSSRSPLVSLELMKNHPLLAKYRFGFKKEITIPWKEKN